MSILAEWIAELQGVKPYHITKNPYGLHTHASDCYYDELTFKDYPIGKKPWEKYFVATDPEYHVYQTYGSVHGYPMDYAASFCIVRRLSDKYYQFSFLVNINPMTPKEKKKIADANLKELYYYQLMSESYFDKGDYLKFQVVNRHDEGDMAPLYTMEEFHGQLQEGEKDTLIFKHAFHTRVLSHRLLHDYIEVLSGIAYDKNF